MLSLPNSASTSIQNMQKGISFSRAQFFAYLVNVCDSSGFFLPPPAASNINELEGKHRRTKALESAIKFRFM